MDLIFFFFILYVCFLFNRCVLFVFYLYVSLFVFFIYIHHDDKNILGTVLYYYYSVFLFFFFFFFLIGFLIFFFENHHFIIIIRISTSSVMTPLPNPHTYQTKKPPKKTRIINDSITIIQHHTKKKRPIRSFFIG